MLVNFVCLICGFIVGAWTLLPIIICLFFAFPITNKLYKGGVVLSKNEITYAYLVSSFLLSIIYIVSLIVLYNYFPLAYFKIFVVGSLIPIVLGKIHGNIVYNKSNIEEYFERNKKYLSKSINVQVIENIIYGNKNEEITSKHKEIDISTYKEVSQEKIEELSSSVSKYHRNQNHNIQYFFSLFPLLKIKQGYVLTSFVSKERVVYPYIKGENEVYGEEEYESIMYGYDDESDENVSFSKNMDKIIFDRNDPNACFEFLIFNYYVSLFFFNASEYGGKVIMTEREKVSISRRSDFNLNYSLEEKGKILKTEIPRKVEYTSNGIICTTLMTTDASYEILLSNYEIKPNNEIYKVHDDVVVKLKVLF